MKALIDTCLVLDFLQRREPFASSAEKLFRASASERFDGFITAKSVTDLYYVIHHYTHNDRETRAKLSKLLCLVGLLDSTADDVSLALSNETPDFEDAVMIETATRSQMDCIVTRNEKDFTKSKVPVFSPDQFLMRIDESDD